MNRKQERTEIYPIRVVVTDFHGRHPKLANITGIAPTGDGYEVEYWHVTQVIGGPENGKRYATTGRETIYGWQIKTVEEVRAAIESAVWDRSAATASRLRKLALAKNAMREEVGA